MKKILLSILICGVMVLGVVGCGKKEQETNKKTTEDYDKELVQCLESQLGGYLVTETDELIEIPFSEIKQINKQTENYHACATN